MKTKLWLLYYEDRMWTVNCEQTLQSRVSPNTSPIHLSLNCHVQLVHWAERHQTDAYSHICRTISIVRPNGLLVALRHKGLHTQRAIDQVKKNQQKLRNFFEEINFYILMHFRMFFQKKCTYSSKTKCRSLAVCKIYI